MTALPQQGARRPVASFSTYQEAQAAVDFLSDRRFPVERLTIVGEDLRFVEQVTGRLGYGQAAIRGLINGAIVGAFVGLLLGLFSLFDPLTSGLALALYGALIGAVSGLIFGLLAHSLTGGTRDFSSVGGMQAGRYVLLADEEVVDEATRALGER